MRKVLLGSALVILVLATAATLIGTDRTSTQGEQGTTPGDPSERRGALVDQVVFTQESDIGKVSGLIESGAHQVFAQGVTSASVFHRIRDSQKVVSDLSYGSSVELSLNPSGPEFDDGSLNPFHVPAMREALNRLINRRYIAEEIYGGLAVPRYLPINTAFPDFARLADVARALELEYQHDPDAAAAVISETMRGLGAVKQADIWHYQGRPVRLIVLIRTEDERRRVGDYVANLLEDQGFRVERRYRTAEEASRIWIAAPPSSGQWHIYTGGWISPSINRDVAADLAYYYTPRGRAEALWQAYEPDPEFDALADRLQRRDYRSWSERQALMARGLELAMKDSSRVWIVDQLNAWPRAENVELAADLAGGTAGSALWPYTLRYRDRLGGSMVMAAPSLLTEPWNPVSGSGWIFDRMILNAIEDSAVMPDPFTGLFWPQRLAGAEVTVEEGVPVNRTLDWLSLESAGEITVPGDAWIDWGSERGEFITVEEAHGEEPLTARSRIRIQYEDGYFDRRWHDGSQVSLADILLPWILSYERADEDSPLFDPAHVPTFEVYRQHFRGWRIVSESPLTIEIYSDQIFPDAENMVGARVPAAQPWHMLALGIRAERAGDIAFSSNKADRLQVDWLNLVGGPSLAILDRHLERARNENYVPFANVLKGALREGEARQRYAAIGDWYAERGHFLVGDGPFYLHSVHAVERSLVLRRFEDFPDASDKWLRFTRAEIPELSLDGPLVVEQGEAAAFRLRITFEGEPYPSEDIEAVRYLLFDGSGELAVRGDAAPDDDGVWSVTLSRGQVEALGSGANSLEFAVTSHRVALPSFATHGFATVPARRAARTGGGE